MKAKLAFLFFKDIIMSHDFKYLTHVEVANLWEQREKIFNDPQVDLKDNEEIDSAGVAFLVQWSKNNNNELIIYNASDNLKSLIKTFRLEPLFILK